MPRHRGFSYPFVAVAIFFFTEISMTKKIYSGIGGQAVMEGIMMRNGKRYAIAVRKPDGEIEVKEESVSPLSEKHRILRWPVIRGVVSFVDSLVLGMKTIMWSSSFIEVDEKKTSENGEPDSVKKTGLSGGEMAFTVVLAIVLAIGIFMVLPTVLAQFLRRWIDSDTVIVLIEGVLRLFLFIGYILLISGMKDIRRTFMYHGSEHKCINCLENGLPLTVENVMKSSKEHKRCGTSFLLFVMLISIIVFMFVRIDILPLRILSRVLLVPVIAGLSYELIRLNGRFDNKLTYILSRPGMWLQGLTTKEPTEDMAEVAICAVERVFDWRKFLKENFEVDIQDLSAE